MNANRYITRTRIIAVVAALIVGVALMLVAVRPAAALAAEGSSSSASSSGSSASASASSASASSASEAAQTGATTGAPLGGLPMMGNDYVWFGNELKLSSAIVDNDLIAAGRTINVVDTMVAGDMRLAAENISIKDSYTGENITAAGENVTVRDCDSTAVVLAGRSVTFSGYCEELSAYAETVFIDGVVEGDVVVGATSVEIGSNARIEGTLYVSAQSEPVVQNGAEAGDIKYTHVETASTADAEGALAAFTVSFGIFAAIIGILGTFVIALLAEWLFRRHTAAAAEMIRTRTGATIATGVVGALLAPVAVVILFFLGVTMPVAVGISLAMFAMTAVAGGFMGASLFKLAFPSLGRFKSAMIGGAIMGVASAIPFVGSIVGAAAFMYFLGYVLQSIFLGMRDASPAAPAPQPTPGPGAPVAPTMPNVAPAQGASPVQGGVPPMQNVPPMANVPTSQQAPYGQMPPSGGPAA